MAAISPNVSSEPQLGTGSKTDFTFNFSIVAATDIGVYVDGVRKAYPNDYTVTFGDVAGTVTFALPPANAAVILFVSEPDYTQASAFADQGAYNLSTVNTINRRAAIRELVNHDFGTRALKVPRGEDAEGPEIPLSDVASIVAVGESLIAGEDIPTVAGALANVGLVAGSITNVNTVAGIHAAVSTVSGVAAAVSTVSGISGNVTTVSGIAANVSTLAPIATSITTVAGISGNVTSVAGISANVTAVAGVTGSITAVAGGLTAINAVATDMALGGGASFILRAPQAAIDAIAAAAAAAASAGAIGTASGTKEIVLGFTTALLPSSAWIANSTIWAFTCPNACTLKWLKTQINAVGSGALDLVIATGNLPGPLTFAASYPLETVAATGIKTWASPAEGGTGWSGAITVPAGAHVLFSSPSGGVVLQNDTTLTGLTRYTNNSPFTSGSKTLTPASNIAIRVRAAVAVTTLQVPRAGLVDAGVLADSATSAPAAKRLVNASVATKYGATLREVGAGSFSANQVATLDTVTADGPLTSLRIFAGSLGTGAVDLLLLTGTAPDFEIKAVFPLTLTRSGDDPNDFTSLNFGTINLLANETLALRIAAGGPTLYQLVSAGRTFYYKAPSVIVSGAGRLDPVPGYVIKAQFQVGHSTLVVDAANLGASLQGVASLAHPGTPLEYDMVVVTGQSNGVEACAQINTETVPAGRAYIQSGASVIPYVGDQASFNATISTTMMTVTSMVSGRIFIGRYLSGPGITPGTQVSGYGSGTGGAGTYTVNVSHTIASPVAMSVLTGSSFVPAFVNQYFAETGRGVIIVQTAMGGSGLDVNSVAGNWSPSGAHRANAVAAVVAAKAAATSANLAWRLAAILAIGPAETDADGIDSGATAISGGAMTAAKHETAWGKLRAYLLTNINPASAGFNVTTVTGSPNLTGVAGTLQLGQPIMAAGVPEGAYVLGVNVTAGTALMSENATASATVACVPGNANLPIILSRVGYKNTGDTAGYVAIRGAQENLTRTYSNIFIGYFGAINWTPRGEIQSTYHGTIVSYGEQGRSMGTQTAHIAAGRA